MRSTVRLTATLAVAVIALAFTGCSSNNTGKIVGKWKMVSGSSSELETLKKMGLTMAWEFKADGTFATSVVSLNDDKGGGTGLADTSKMPRGKYNLGFGNTVNFTDDTATGKDKRMTTNITIDGDNMTMKDPDGTTMQLVRVK